VRRGRRLLYSRRLSARFLYARFLYALPAAFILLVAVSPAVARVDPGRVEHVGAPSLRDVDSSLASLSAGVAERVPVPSIWPMQAVSVDGVAGLGIWSWFVVVLAVTFVLGGAGLTRRERAPPRLLVSL
jgi:hypothetical protein